MPIYIGEETTRIKKLSLKCKFLLKYTLFRLERIWCLSTSDYTFLQKTPDGLLTLDLSGDL